jgi:hypothetical protein
MQAAVPPGSPHFIAFVEQWNQQQGQDTPALHRRMAAWLEARWQAGDRHLLLMAFRGSGKSTMVGLFCAWLLLCDPALRLLVLAAERRLAARMVRNVRRLIERHPLTAGLRPERPEQWGADRFTIARMAELREPSMQALGLDSNITGSRADAIICDDVEVPRTSDSAAKREKLREQLSEIDFVLVPGGLVLLVGTPHTRDTLYAEDTGIVTGFADLRIPVLDAQGHSAWPERFPPERIARLRQRVGALRFASQMMLDPVDLTQARLDPARLRRYEDEILWREAQGQPEAWIGPVRLVALCAWWDPAYGASAGERAAGDGSVIAVAYRGEDERIYLHRVVYLTVPGAADNLAMAQCMMVAELARALDLHCVHVESNGIGKFLPGMLRGALHAAGTGASVVEVTSRQNKDSRILQAWDVPLMAGRLQVHESVFATPLIGEMRDWRPGGGHRDDGLDAVAGCLNQLDIAPAQEMRLSAPRTHLRSAARPVVARHSFKV